MGWGLSGGVRGDGGAKKQEPHKGGVRVAGGAQAGDKAVAVGAAGWWFEKRVRGWGGVLFALTGAGSVGVDGRGGMHDVWPSQAHAHHVAEAQR